MKHFLFMTIAFLLLTNPVQSQKTYIGVKGGLNAYTVSVDDNADYNTKFGYNVGLLGHIHMATSFAIQPEIVYSTQGTTFDFGGVDNNLKLNYVNIPLNFQYMFDNGFRLQAGPQLGFLVGADLESGNNVTDLKDNFKSTDFGLTVGMSYVKPSTGFGIDLRYNHGLTNINTTDVVKTYNRGVQFGVFYLFKHKS